MSEACCSGKGISYPRVLWIALVANAAMFLVELVAAAWSGSSALAADAADFLGDSANYALSLGAIALGGAWVSRCQRTASQFSPTRHGAPGSACPLSQSPWAWSACSRSL